MIKILILIMMLTASSCFHKKCDEAYENSRAQSRDTTLMYLWRYTDDLIKPDGQNTDSGFISLKRNGDYCWSTQQRYLHSCVRVWYSNKDIIYDTYCLDNVPNDNKVKYKIKDDTLSLWGDMMDGTFNTTSKTYVKVLKY